MSCRRSDAAPIDAASVKDCRSLCAPVNYRQILLVLCVGLQLCGGGTQAGEVTLKNGLRIPGKPLDIEAVTRSTARSNVGNVTIKHLWMIEDGLRRYFVPQRQVPKDAVDRSTLITVDEYHLRHQRSGRSVGPSIVGSFVNVTPFDEFGRRTVTLAGPKGDIPIQQAITRLRPDIVTVESTSHHWEHALSTWTIRPNVLDSLLKQATDPTIGTERLKLVHFYIDAEMYGPAQQELAAMLTEFPELKGRLEETQRELAHYVAIKALNEIRLRQAAGQHRLAFAVADGFPQEMVSADLRREASDLSADYRRQFDQIARVQMQLGTLEADLTEEQAVDVRPLRSVVSETLTVDTLDRLEPFLRALPDDTLEAEEKLALAYSGWLLGPANADISLPAAVRLWQIRFLVHQFLHSTSVATQRDILRDLDHIDGATVQTIAAMIEQLLPTNDDPLPDSGVPTTVEIEELVEGRLPIRYVVTLPLEYSPQRSYPMIVVLRSQGMTEEQESAWWAGTAANPGYAMKRGYIVIAPQYAEPDTEKYNYSQQAQTSVIAAIRDARKRFAVDSDRIFLGGHGMGGDAVFDLGMSQPDLFAGVIPITGVADKHCTRTWKNARLLPWYIIGGQKDRDTLERNAHILNEMMKRGYDLIYCEYIERGYESYFEELPRLFDWMELHVRADDQPEFDVDILRPTASEWYWLSIGDFPKSVLQPVVWKGTRTSSKPQSIRGTITTPGNTVIVGSSGKRVTIKLSPDLINFEERVKIKIGSRMVHRGFIKPSVEALLSDLHERGDRQRLYWARMDF